MKLHQLHCPHCHTSLHASLGDTVVTCPKCGHQYQMVVHATPGEPAHPKAHESGHAHHPQHPKHAESGHPSHPAHAKHHEPAHAHHPPRRKKSLLARIFVVIAGVLAVAGTVALIVVLNNPDTTHNPPAKPAPHAVTKPQGKKSFTFKGTESNGTDIGKLGLLDKWKKQDKPDVPPVKPEWAIYQTAAPATPSTSQIDKFVTDKLRENGIALAAPSTDGVFIRRVYLDVIGTLPTAEETKAFLKDTNPKKREILIDQLLQRKEFADYWAMKWCDILRVKSEFPINLWPNAVRAYHGWIRASIRDNKPFDQFARDLLTASGSNFRNPPANFYRALQKKDAQNSARAAALTFMGVRPSTWPEERWSGMAVFFNRIGYKKTLEWKEEIVFFDQQKSVSPGEKTGVFPDGTKATIVDDQDPRFAFADWLITPKNPWFTQNFANRVWAWLVGRGIIHEPDDMRPDNPPSNPELLAYLTQEVINARYDMKHLYRLILNSKTYQCSCIPATEHPKAAALFASYPIRRLDAEVLIDAICQITGTYERYSSPIPEPFTYLPQGHRAISVPDASITSPFLELFGRPPRDTGLESERNNTLTPAQKLHLLNSMHIQKKIEQGPGLAALFSASEQPQKVAEELYLTILSRYPTREELIEVESYMQLGAQGRKDVAWALINSTEFVCRH